MDTIISITYTQQLEQLGINFPKEIIYSPYFKLEYDTETGFIKHTFKKTRVLIESYGYFPSFEIKTSKFGDSERVLHSFKFQCSVPKLIRGSSYYLTNERDLDIFTHELSRKFEIIGLKIPPESIKQLTVSQVAICHNIVVPQELGTAYDLIHKLFHVELTKQHKNKDHREYAEQTHGIAFRTHSRSISFKLYDKYGEIKNGKHKTETEKRILQDIRAGNLPKHVFRIEKTLQDKQAVKRAFKQTTDVEIQQLFNDAFVKDQLIKFCDTYLNDYKVINADLFTIVEEDEVNLNFFEKLNKLVKEELHLSGNASYLILLEMFAGKVFGDPNKVSSIMSEVHGRNYDKNRSKYRNKLNDAFAQLELSKFSLCKASRYIRKQVEDFHIYKNDDQLTDLVEAGTYSL